MSDACLKTITDSIADLEKAKSFLARRLDEARQRRLCLEDTHSVWQQHLAQSSQEGERSLQHLHLAQNELGQSNTKLNTLRELFDRKNESVKDLQRQIEEEKESRKKGASDHEYVLESICQSLKDLKVQNSPGQLKSQIQNMDENTKRRRIQTFTERHRTKALQQKLDSLTSENAGEKDGAEEEWSDLETIRGDQQLIQSLLHEDQVKVKERIYSITEQLQILEMEANEQEA